MDLKYRKFSLGVLFFAALCALALLAGASFQPAAAQDAAPQDAVDSAARFYVYVPLAPKQILFQLQLPVIAGAPVISPIDNVHGAYLFNVTWSAYPDATYYVLQQARTPDFDNLHIVYSGPDLSAMVFVDQVGEYYYRVRAVGAGWQSEWSLVQTTLVRFPPPPCPAEGVWSGATSLGTEFTFMVSPGPQCHIQWVEIAFPACGEDMWAEFTLNYPIINNEFFAGGVEARVLGSFTGNGLAEGTFFIKTACPASPGVVDYATGSWIAASP